MPQVEGIFIERFAESGIILEKNYALQIAFSLLGKDPDCRNLEKLLNANWGQEIIYFDYAKTSGVILSAQGAPYAANAVERLRRTGVKSIVSIGTAGSTNSTIESGSFVLPIAGVRDEGASQGYLELNVPSLANMDLVQTLTSSFKFLNLETLSGVIYTTDKRYKEDAELLRFLNEHAGVVAIDMETAALFITAMYYNIPAAAVKIISDCAVSEEGAPFQGVFKEFIHPCGLIAPVKNRCDFPMMAVPKFIPLLLIETVLRLLEHAHEYHVSHFMRKNHRIFTQANGVFPGVINLPVQSALITSAYPQSSLPRDLRKAGQKRKGHQIINRSSGCLAPAHGVD